MKIYQLDPKEEQILKDGVRQAAAGFGCMAALEAERWLRNLE